MDNIIYKIGNIKYLLVFSLLLFLTSCSAEIESASANSTSAILAVCGEYILAIFSLIVLDGKYIILTDKSFLPDEYKRKWKVSDDEVKILVTDKKFYYEGTTTRKPFLVQIYYDRSTFSGQTSATSFVIEPGDIQIHITDWYEEGNVSGTLINKDYNTCVIERRNLVNRIFRTIRLKGQTSEAEGTYSFGSAFEDFEKGELAFFEKYAKYPDVVRVMLSRYLEVKELNKDWWMLNIYVFLT